MNPLPARRHWVAATVLAAVTAACTPAAEPVGAAPPPAATTSLPGEPTRDGAAVKPQTSGAEGGDGAPAVPAPSSDADKALVALKAEARKLVAADSAALANGHGYDQAIQRQLRDMEGTGLLRRLPSRPVTERQLRTLITEHCLQHSLVLEKVTLGEPPAPAPVPAEHRGEGPYPFTPDQYIATAPLQVVVASDDLTLLERWWRTLPRGVEPMLELVALSIADGRATFHGSAYWRRDVKPPVHVAMSPSLEQLAQLAGVAVPVGHPRLGEVTALLAEHQQIVGQLGAAMASLGQANLLGRTFQFYRQRVKAIESRTFPKPMYGAAP